MEIIITQWALDSFLDLKHRKAFTADEYRNILRPDALLLKQYPKHTKFGLSSFWSPAEINGNKIPGGFKMKWDSLGSGKAEMRLPILLQVDAFLSEAYIKTGSIEPRKLARFKVFAELIRHGRHTERGRLK